MPQPTNTNGILPKLPGLQAHSGLWKSHSVLLKVVTNCQVLFILTRPYGSSDCILSDNSETGGIVRVSEF